MSLEAFKQSYRKLSPSDRKALAKWIVDQELGSSAGAPSSGLGGLRLPPGLVKVLIALGTFCVVGAGLWWGWSHYQAGQAEAARKSQAEREAEEARRPRSPTNLEFLRQNIGREVTITGVPQAYEVGFLFFSKDPRRSLRLNLLPGGVVVLQSTELAELVENQVEVTVTGVVEEAPDGALEIKVRSVGQLQRRERR